MRLSCTGGCQTLKKNGAPNKVGICVWLASRLPKFKDAHWEWAYEYNTFVAVVIDPDPKVVPQELKGYIDFPHV